MENNILKFGLIWSCTKINKTSTLSIGQKSTQMEAIEPPPCNPNSKHVIKKF